MLCAKRERERGQERERECDVASKGTHDMARTGPRTALTSPLTSESGICYGTKLVR